MTSPGETMLKEQPAEPHPPQQLSTTGSIDGPPLTNTTSNETTTTTTRRILDDEDEMNQSVNFLTNQYTTTAGQDAIHASRSNNTSSHTSRSSSFGINETHQQQYHHQQQQQQNINRTHTTGETKLSKIFIRVVFGSCMFSIFTTLVRSQLYTLPRTTRHEFYRKN